MTTPRTDDPGRATDICDDDDIQVSVTAAVPCPLFPELGGGVWPAPLGPAELVINSLGHAGACGCWPCVQRFAREVQAWSRAELPPHWRAAAREYHADHLGDHVVVLGHGRRTSQAGAAATTLEALIYDVRTRGLAAVADRSRRYRITELTQHQLEEVCRRLAVQCAACPQGVPTSIINSLVKVWKCAR